MLDQHSRRSKLLYIIRVYGLHVFSRCYAAAVILLYSNSRRQPNAAGAANEFGPAGPAAPEPCGVYTTAAAAHVRVEMYKYI